MGLFCSHNAFHRSYGTFNRLRQIIAKAVDGSFPPHEDRKLNDDFWYWGDGFSKNTHPGLFIFMQHSDCDGEISPNDCIKVAKDLEALCPKIEQYDINNNYISLIKMFVKGCLLAAKNNESLTFC